MSARTKIRNNFTGSGNTVLNLGPGMLRRPLYTPFLGSGEWGFFTPQGWRGGFETCTAAAEFADKARRSDLKKPSADLPWMVVSQWATHLMLEHVASEADAARLLPAYRKEKDLVAVWVVRTASIAAFRRECRQRAKVFAGLHAKNNAIRTAAMKAWNKAIDRCKRTAKNYGKAQQKAALLSWRAHAKALGLKPVSAKSK